MQRPISSSFSNLTILGSDAMKRCELCLSISASQNTWPGILASAMARYRIEASEFRAQRDSGAHPPFSFNPNAADQLDQRILIHVRRI